jgi:hypothetical protein
MRPTRHLAAGVTTDVVASYTVSDGGSDAATLRELRYKIIGKDRQRSMSAP